MTDSQGSGKTSGSASTNSFGRRRGRSNDRGRSQMRVRGSDHSLGAATRSWRAIGDVDDGSNHDRADSRSRGFSRGKGRSRSRGRRQGYEGGSQDTFSRGLCYSWDSSGTCRFGSDCRFEHRSQVSLASNGIAASSSSSIPEASDDVSTFMDRVSAAIARPRGTIRLDNPRDIDLWRGAWSAIAMGASIKHGAALVQMYMRLPSASAYTPPNLVVWRALKRVVDAVQRRDIIKLVEQVADVVEYRLLPRPGGADCISAASDLRTAGLKTLTPAINTAHMAAATARLMARFLGLVDRALSEMEHTEQADADKEASGDSSAAWTGWRQPTLNWLQRGKWLDAPRLSVHYTSIEHYADTVCRLMTMLTFYWGAGALFPKCRNRRDPADNACDQPLCTRINRELKLRCSRKRSDGSRCAQDAKWRCARNGHDVICDRCIRTVQASLVGEPGRHASTDVYDGIVERETLRRDANVYIISYLVSRKPPSINPNWSTTYRLKCSALVAVVRLSVSGEPLAENSKIEWAEIVPVNPQSGDRLDHKERARGRLALRLLTRADLSSLKGDSEALQAGLRVAIIDLQVFLPEVIPVLSALTDPELMDHLRNIKFSSQLLGHPPADEGINHNNDVDVAIRHAIESTQLDVVMRLERKSSLISRISTLAKKYNLSGSQLTAFASALSSSLHCTQGPPGTGKSYLGVVLIKALDMIRDAAFSEGVHLGPILVISYKNHALDEILLDVLKNDKLRGGQLIRCGRAENEMLSSYTERNTYEEREAQSELARRVECLRSVRRSTRDLRALQSAFGDESGMALQTWSPSRKRSYSGETSLNVGMEVVTIWIFELMRLHVSLSGLEVYTDSKHSYCLLEKFTLQDQQVLHDEERALIDGIAELAKDNEHWLETDSKCRSLFLLAHWLKGNNPPPRCAAAEEDGCALASEVHGGYCKQAHACLAFNGCLKRREDGVNFCIDHCCQYNRSDLGPDGNCQQPRLTVSRVCKRHACFICLKLKDRPVLAKVEQACENHTCIARRCTGAIVRSRVPFCNVHVCHMCARLGYVNSSEPGSGLRMQDSLFCIIHKCSYQNCSNVKVEKGSGQDFCSVHGCRACVGKRKLVHDAKPVSIFCKDHRCPYVIDRIGNQCTNNRDIDSEFCSTHTCFVCRRNGLPLDAPVIDEEPRNVCKLHLLCSFIEKDGELCRNQAAKGNARYCEQHDQLKTRKILSRESAIKKQCEGTTSRNTRCKTTGSCSAPPFYCRHHISQRPISSSESSSDTDSDDEMYDESASEQAEKMTSMDIEPESNAIPDAAMVQNFETDTELEFVKSERSAADFLSGEDTVVPGTHDIEYPEGQMIQNENEKLIHSASNQESKRDYSESLELSTTIVHETEVGGEEILVSSLLDSVSSDNGNYAEQQPKSNKASVDESASAENESDSKHHVLTATIQNDSSLDDDDSSSESGSLTDIMSSSSDDGNVERVAFDVAPDELNIDGEDDIPENLQHLLEIDGGNVMSGSDSEGESDVPICNNEIETTAAAVNDPSKWTWEDSLPQRWGCVRVFIGNMLSRFFQLATLADDYVDLARKDLAEKSAISFKSAKIIGATVVGATRRLHALRASEPFAMIVEEACEVMEPTLLSVLSVRSLCKLELIGDHRQLPAFIHQCWFNIQNTHPTIKVSLFERLVENDAAPFSVLDVQRRMRPEICDLTRIEYRDVVEIKDDECTVKQCVSDRVNKDTMIPSKQREKSILECTLWANRGRSVPGIKPQVYFWDLESKEGRASVGLSRCNHGEAEASVSLIRWLILCGVHPACITLITPFKGQKVTITKLLQKEDNVQLKKIFISTVDRYQGDENDIIILSLVSTRPGNRFVALRNRFIVSASRARLGFYIIGTSAAVAKSVPGASGPSHWSRLLKDLESSPHPGEETRIGKAFPICCPRHHQTSRDIDLPKQFPTSIDELEDFCSERCTQMLSWCGHQCQRPCHSLKAIPHTTDCGELVDRPCKTHEDVPLTCCFVRKQSKSSGDGAGNTNSSSLAVALNHFRCEVMVDYRRPECPHFVQLECHRHQLVLEQKEKLPDCAIIVDDFVHPSCGHVFSSPKCAQRRHWENEPPECKVKVIHLRDCGCKAHLTCHASVLESASNERPKCLEAVVKPRPRCSHPLSSRCFEATLLADLWHQQNGEAVTGDPPVVFHGIEYGPSEKKLSEYELGKELPNCFVKMNYQRSCGHLMSTRCEDAFKLATGEMEESPCAMEITAKSPLCGHEINVVCDIKDFILTLPPSPFVDRLNEDDNELGIETVGAEDIIVTAPEPNPRLKKLSSSCTNEVSIVRKCGHVTRNFSCTKLFSLFKNKLFPMCNAVVELTRDCGHKFETVCHRVGQPIPQCTEPVNDIFMYPFCRHNHFVRPGSCGKLTDLRVLDEQLCPVKVDCRRPRCLHVALVPCHLEKAVTQEFPGERICSNERPITVEEGVDYCNNELQVKDCTELVTYHRECGHEEMGVPCKVAFDWAACPENAPVCHATVKITSPLCEHEVQVICSASDEICETSVWRDSQPEHITLTFGDSPITCPVVIEGVHEPVWSKPIAALRCGFTTRLQRQCGHEDDVRCDAIFMALKSRCEQMIEILCEDCETSRRVKCFEYSTGAPNLCHNLVEKICSDCGITKKRVECNVKKVRCEEPVCVKRDCGHELSWICGEEDPLSKARTVPCSLCLLSQWNIALCSAKETFNVIKSGSQSNLSLEVDIKQLVNDLRRCALRLMNGYDILRQEDLFHVELEKDLRRSHIDIMERRIDLLQEGVENEATDKDILHAPPSLENANESYDIVYEISKKDSDLKTFHPQDTLYGLGVMCKLLNGEAIEGEEKSLREDGTLHLNIAAVLRVRGLHGVNPFRLPREKLMRKTNNRKKKKHIDPDFVNKAIKKCREKMMKYREAGFDHVIVTEGTKKDKKPSKFERVYWVAEAVMPLMKLHVALQRQCIICLDQMLPQKGWVCCSDHFVCRDCFYGYVEQAGAAGALMRSADNDGNVKCPANQCEAVYDALSLFSQGHDASEEELQLVFEGLQKLKLARHSKREVTAALDIQKRQLETEFLRIQNIANADERRAETIRLELIDGMLTLHCPNPRCKLAFIDFDGCFAVTCHSCKANFCAWCIDHWTMDDVHGHVPGCRESLSPGQFYGSQQLFRQAQTKRKKRLVIQRLQREDNDVRKRVLERMRKDFEDVGIYIDHADFIGGNWSPE